MLLGLLRGWSRRPGLLWHGLQLSTLLINLAINQVLDILAKEQAQQMERGCLRDGRCGHR